VHSYKEFLVDPSEDPVFRGMKKPKTVSAVTQALAGQVYEHAKEGRLVLTLGGDHSIAIGTIAGVAKAVRERTGKEVGVVWGEWFPFFFIPFSFLKRDKGAHTLRGLDSKLDIENGGKRKRETA